MADTGFRDPTDSTGQLYVYVTNTYDDDSDYGQVFEFSGNVRTAYWHGFSGDDIPSGATITGAELKVRCRYVYNQIDAAMYLALDNDDENDAGAEGATFSSAKLTGGLTVNAADYTLGGSSDDWGLSWGTSGVDISKIVVKGYVGWDVSAIYIWDIYNISLKIHYETAAPVIQPGGITMKSGNITLKSGKIKIK